MLNIISPNRLDPHESIRYESVSATEKLRRGKQTALQNVIKAGEQM
jgi:hypothetical protein